MTARNGRSRWLQVFGRDPGLDDDGGLLVIDDVDRAAGPAALRSCGPADDEAGEALP